MRFVFAACFLVANGLKLKTEVTSTVNLGDVIQNGKLIVDQCTEPGQKNIMRTLHSLLEQGPTSMLERPNLPSAPSWPKNLLEESDWFDNWDPQTRFQAITLITAFHPFFAMDNFLKEIRDALLCGLKVMECMSIDFMALPIETLLGTKKLYAIQDAMGIGTTTYKWHINQLGAIRSQYLEPAMWLYFVTMVEPSKNFVERFVPQGHPFGAMPSLPAALGPTQTDWDATADYTKATSTAKHNQYLEGAIEHPGYFSPNVNLAGPNGNMENVLPEASGPAVNLAQIHPPPPPSVGGEGQSALQTLMRSSNDSRQQCNERTTETKKLLCHLDYFQVQLRLGSEMIKRGELDNVSAEKKQAIVASFAQLEAKVNDDKQGTIDACEKQRST